MPPKKRKRAQRPGRIPCRYIWLFICLSIVAFDICFRTYAALFSSKEVGRASVATTAAQAEAPPQPLRGLSRPSAHKSAFGYQQPLHRPRNYSFLPLLEQSARGTEGLPFTDPALHYPGWWAWNEAPAAAPSAEPAAGEASHQCLALNSEFSPPTVTTAFSQYGRLVRTLSYGPWRVRWPRFAEASHALWFASQGLAASRQSAHPCVQEYDQRRAAARAAQQQQQQQPSSGLAAPLLSPAPAVQPAFPTLPGQTALGAGEPPLDGGWASPSSTSDHWLYFCEPRYTEGRVVLTDSVRVSQLPDGHDCGPEADLDALLANAQRNFPPSADVAVPGPLFWGVIPATWTWQHWCENTLPKLAQVEAAVAWEEVWGAGNGGPAPAQEGSTGVPPRLLGGQPHLHHPLWHLATANQELLPERVPIVPRLYTDALGMAPPLDVREGPLSTPRLIHGCAAPPVHPFLWQLGQSNALRLGPFLPLARRSKLVYCSRRDANTTEHPGRLLLNEEAVVQLLWAQCRASRAQGGGCTEVVWYNHRHFNNSIAAMAEFFQNAIGLVSPHGGCLTNVNLLPCNAAVLEIMPLLAGEGVPSEPHWHVSVARAEPA